MQMNRPALAKNETTVNLAMDMKMYFVCCKWKYMLAWQDIRGCNAIIKKQKTLSF